MTEPIRYELIVYDSRGNGDGKTVNTLTGDHENRITDYTSVVCEAPYTMKIRCSCEGGAIPSHQGCGYSEDDVVYGIENGQVAQLGFHNVVGSLNCMHDQQAVIQGTEQQFYIVRRLTPTECARLQGFPDWWCSDLGTENLKEDEIAFWSEVLETENPTEENLPFWRDVFDTYARINGKKPRSDKQILKWLKNPHTDSAEYKMWGNGVALPCVDFVLWSIAAVCPYCGTVCEVEENDLAYSRYSNQTMTKEEAYLEFADYLNEKEMEAMK